MFCSCLIFYGRNRFVVFFEQIYIDFTLPTGNHTVQNATPVHHTNPISCLAPATNIPHSRLRYFHEHIFMPSNEHHKWLKKRNWPTVIGAMMHSDRDVDLLARKYKERDEHGRLPHHWMAAKAQTHTHALAVVGVESISYNVEANTTRDNKGETPIDIASRSGACAEIIGLLSLTPEEAHSLGLKGMLGLYAPVHYWWNEMLGWMRSRSWADCHKFINEHDDELVSEVLKYDNSELLQGVACYSQIYTDSLVFFALRIIHRHPLSLTTKNDQGNTALQYAEHPQFNACKDIVKVLRLTPKDISSTPFPTLLRQHLPTQFVDEEIFGTYNTACTFIKHMKYDKAELLKVEDVLKPKLRKRCSVCNSFGRLMCARCKQTFYCTLRHQTAHWKKHKKTCKAPTTPPASEAELRILHEGMLLLNRCIQEPGAGDGPTSEVLSFLRSDSALGWTS